MPKVKKDRVNISRAHEHPSKRAKIAASQIAASQIAASQIAASQIAASLASPKHGSESNPLSYPSLARTTINAARASSASWSNALVANMVAV
jgi:hypothetical protein